MKKRNYELLWLKGTGVGVGEEKNEEENKEEEKGKSSRK